jgi:hypothetical protein
MTGGVCVNVLALTHHGDAPPCARKRNLSASKARVKRLYILNKVDVPLILFLHCHSKALGPVDRFPPVDAEWIPKSVFR